MLTLPFISLFNFVKCHEYDFKPILDYNVSFVNLNSDNFVSLRETVNDNSVSKVIKDLSSLTTNKYINDYYLFLDTNGGSVLSGNHLIDYLNYLNSTNIIVHCLAKKAISMGFVILQACPGERLALPSALIMQHQMSSMMRGNLLSLETDFKYTKRLYEKMLIKQSNRIGLTPEDFLNLTRDDWWLDGEMALDSNVVDKLVNVGCDQEIIKKQITIKKESIFGDVKIKGSKCPII